jgi:hypothetical protein
MKLLTIFPIFTKRHAQVLSTHVEHVLICDKRTPFNGNGTSTKVVPLSVSYFGINQLLTFFNKEGSLHLRKYTFNGKKFKMFMWIKIS